MIYQWCTKCYTRTCLVEDSHRAARYIFYRADFMLGGRYGKRIRKMFANKKDAEAFEYITLADYKRGLYITTDTSKIKYEDFFKKYKEEYVDRYMKGAKSEEYRLRVFGRLYSKRMLHTFVLNDWNNYLNERLRQENPVSKTSLNRELTSIKVMFNWAVKNKYLKANPFDEATKFKEENIKVRWLDDKEIEMVLNACTEAKDLDLRDILELAMNTGFRKANLKAVTAHDINNNRIEAKRTKSGKAYEVPISSNLAILLKRLVSTRPNRSLLNFYNFRKRFARIIKDSTITLHVFRHTFAAQCLKRGIPIDRVCAWLGHHSVEFTRKHYGHLCPSQEAIEIELLNLGRVRGTRTQSTSQEVL